MGLTKFSDQQRTHIPSSTLRLVLVHGGLFLATFITTMLAGTSWLGNDVLDISSWVEGLTYASLIMTFIAAHEFGHYFAARAHKVDVSLPYFIPWPLPILNPFGTMGALIRTRTPIVQRRVLFDIGVAGPLAGFIVCLIILAIGFLQLPDYSYLLQIHPEYLATGSVSNQGLFFGDIPLYSFMQNMFAKHGAFIPPMNEIYHYPFLCVGWFGLFLTALNMMPFGQLDGGHVLYALIGRKQWKVANVLWIIMFSLTVLSLVGILQSMVAEPTANSTLLLLQSVLDKPLTSIVSSAPWLFSIGQGWMIWIVLVRFVIRLQHPTFRIASPFLSQGQ